MATDLTESDVFKIILIFPCPFVRGLQMSLCKLDQWCRTTRAHQMPTVNTRTFELWCNFMYLPVQVLNTVQRTLTLDRLSTRYKFSMSRHICQMSV